MKKINIKLSITALFLLGVVGVVNINCSEDVLDQVNPNKLSPDTFWQSQGDAEKGIIGAYSPFTHIWYYTRFEIFISDYRDDVVNGFNTSERTAVGYFSGTSDSNATRWCWQAMYQGVARANEVLKYVPDIDDPEFSQQEKDNILGEAYFIRAFNYFNLLNNWRNIPLITKPTSEVDLFTVTQADPADVWAQIESDLQMAQTMLPDSWSADQLGRATSGAATGYLGKVYLYQNKYAEAKVEFAKIMDGRYQLMDDYAHNFTEEFENNAESVFEIQLVADGLGGWGADAPNRGKGAAYQPDLAPAGYTGQDGMRINQWALDLFLDEQTVNGEIDPRTYTTFFWNTEETTTYEGKTLRSRTYLNTPYSSAYSPTATEIYANKFLDWEFNNHSGSQDGGWHGSGNNLRLMRYADVLLMYAEADLMDDNNLSADGLEAINAVRRRADMPEFTSVTMQDIEDERVKELSLERSRYFDLLRWGKVKSRIVDNPDLKSESAGTSAYKPGREYIAIPQNDVDRNPNLKQNPGY
ncbi:RagB/SusD family nutrient uptake outer membrane protein [Seonamhaeicola algicola]|uniref:RagB/SusD family nutrient uptake outer membrane protein n=1 Tax=Seonamhaeicola algicola TaxID=1719036 RepID=A0A5C7AIB3_9FLAO|nr:RagB/SusD family nutrient uptake outer membrane protein [Seonamhaeicola algicola]TXE07213.1 RagB/SusD family nutrient uptake outer membrane protein [Seonamhaeicola algicola]